MTRKDSTTRIKSLWQEIQNTDNPVLVLCADTRQLRALYNALRNCSDAPEQIHCFPDREILTYDTISTAAHIVAERMQFLYQCCNGASILLSTVANAAHRLSPQEWLLSNCFMVRRGEQRSLMTLAALLNRAGYQRVPIVNEAHEYALRGGVLDVFLPAHKLPIRLDFYDDEIEQLRYFDPLTQLGEKSTLNEIRLLPAFEYPQSKEARTHFCKMWQYHFGGALRGNFYQAIEDNGHATGAEYYLPLFFEHLETLFDYLPNNTVLITDPNHKHLHVDFWKTIDARMKERLDNSDYPMLATELLFLPEQEWQQRCAELTHIECELHQDTEHASITATPPTNKLPKARTDSFGASINALNELHDGDFIVHEDYGIGRYRGLENLEIEGVKQDYIFLEYADKDELYLPIHTLSLIYRHNNNGVIEPPLHSLRGKRWKTQRQKVYKLIEDTAAKLIETQAKRQISETILQAHIPDEYKQFSKSFAFTTTADQQKAIDDVLNDLQAPAPMDRLICGDVGFGKTEVAARACFVAAFNGWQSVMLVPTTLLAEQHMRNFSERFAGFPINIASLTRNVKEAQLKNLLAQIKSGDIDILIGTHRLLHADIQFATLGLAIVDEEHRFGVAHKERIARMRTSVNLLGMTATPIPRTLHMSMNALRDLSLIGTPPEKRLPIQTCVSPLNDALIREAIQRELQRGGQVYYLHNDIDSIETCVRRVRQLAPKAIVDSIHGRMPRIAVKNVMSGFYERAVHVLVCTTIIESGLDVPNANTIIIERADMLGLAQLHQLRGRVGRADRQAYAWLLTPGEHKPLKLDARRRLAAIVEHNQLGVGFNLATQDMEIRGVGSLLGKEQSGQAENLGVAFYLRALNRVIRGMRENNAEDVYTDDTNRNDIKLSLGISALLPEEWISDISVRLNMYRCLADAKTQAQLNDLQIELRDRFGRLPELACNLLRCGALRLQAKTLDIQEISLQRHRGCIVFLKHVAIGPDMLRALMSDKSLDMKISIAQERRLNFEYQLADPDKRLEFIEHILMTLSSVSTAA